jgi:pyrimidine deaminase RibD-like protein/RNA-binding protein YhbY
VDAYPGGGGMDDEQLEISSNIDLLMKVRELSRIYTATSDGPEKLFLNQIPRHNNQTLFTAFVTLEPCSHFGRTPPCAEALYLAGINRVVVGCRDPNPRVNGGGVTFLGEKGIAVHVLESEAQTIEVVTNLSASQACAKLVSNFCKRMKLRKDSETAGGWQNLMSGRKRSILRTLAGKRKADRILQEICWEGNKFDFQSALLELNSDKEDSLINTTILDEMKLDARWMEHLDNILWQHELVLLRFNSAGIRKKYAKVLGKRMAQDLDACLVQTVGHTCLLFRPSDPPGFNLGMEVIDDKIT